MNQTILLSIFAVILSFSNMNAQQAGRVLDIESMTHSDVRNLSSLDEGFGASVITIGDLNMDGIFDIAVGAGIGPSNNRGGLYILTLDSNLVASDTMRIAYGESGFLEQLGSLSGFGTSGSYLGDLDGDGNIEIAVGALVQSTGSAISTGAVFILSIDWNTRTVVNTVRITSNSGGFSGSLNTDDFFGINTCNAGDLDGDGVFDLIVGAEGVSKVDNNEGALFILYLNPNGTVKAHKEINRVSSPMLNIRGGFNFGSDVDVLGDIDGDNNIEIIVGVPGGNEINGTDFGAYWILSLDNQQNVIAKTVINKSTVNYSSEMDSIARIGSKVETIGDIDGNGVADVAIFALAGETDSVSTNHLAICFLSSQGGLDDMTVLKSSLPVFSNYTRLQDLSLGNFSGGSDFSSDGKYDLVLGAPGYNSNEGQINFIFLDGISHISIPEFEHVADWVSVSPNPSDGLLTIEQLRPGLNSAEIEVLNMNGQLVHTASFSGQKTTFELNVPSGNYFVRVKNEEQRQYQVEKIIIQ